MLTKHECKLAVQLFYKLYKNKQSQKIMKLVDMS
jgi:hypothetical protein